VTDSDLPLAIPRVKLGEYASGTGRPVFFTCPGCSDFHQITIDTPEGWSWNEDLVLPTFLPSVLVRWNMAGQEFRCHSFVQGGRIEFLTDCTHALAGSTVDLPVWTGFPWDDSSAELPKSQPRE
jgi:hypothetical protein